MISVEKILQWFIPELDIEQFLMETLQQEIQREVDEEFMRSLGLKNHGKH